MRWKTMGWLTGSILGMAIALAPTVRAETAAELRQRAVGFARQGQWEAALEAYREALRTAPDEPWTWFAMGSVLHGMGRFAEAAEAWESSLERKVSVPGYVQYNLACAKARVGDGPAALGLLEQAAASGLFSAQAMREDPDLESLRGERRFAEIAEAADLAHRPCLHRPEYRQFDFWLGTWDVRIPAGFRASRDVIRRSEDGCVVTHEWTGTLGARGRSHSYYDATSETWIQVWITSTGINGTMTGGLDEDGFLVLEGPGATPGNLIRSRWKPLDPDTVEVSTVTSTDGGDTWSASSLNTFQRVDE